MSFDTADKKLEYQPIDHLIQEVGLFRGYAYLDQAKYEEEWGERTDGYMAEYENLRKQLEVPVPELGDVIWRWKIRKATEGRLGQSVNEKMEEYADALFAFVHGESRGTKHMINVMQLGKPMCTVELKPEEN